MLTKIDIISGFLGAGKTTMINKILEDLVRVEKVAVIENEFGETGVDAQLLKKHGVTIKEINSGCICCALFGDFVTVTRILISQYHPERIIVEPTGLGKLSDVIKACRNVAKIEKIRLNMLITVVDCLKYDMYSYMFGEFFKDQIQESKTIMVSRTQFAEEGFIEEMRRDLFQLNKEANIITESWDHLTGAEIVQIGESNKHKKINQLFVDTNDTHDQDRRIQVWNRFISARYSREQFHEKLITISSEENYGMVIRGKGFFQTTEGDWLQFDYTANEINFSNIEAQQVGKVVIIGKDINEAALDNLWKT